MRVYLFSLLVDTYMYDIKRNLIRWWCFHAFIDYLSHHARWVLLLGQEVLACNANTWCHQCFMVFEMILFLEQSSWYREGLWSWSMCRVSNPRHSKHWDISLTGSNLNSVLFNLLMICSLLLNVTLKGFLFLSKNRCVDVVLACCIGERKICSMFIHEE